MRLLETLTLRVKEFSDPYTTPEYAILSHTWDEEEVNFPDLKEPYAHKMKGYRKIIDSCRQARKDGFDHLWMDTCCIDKTSSAELSEAINSMYRWYSTAQVCYAYLSDVPFNQDRQSQGSSFAGSRWFTRGWTLQELLGPQSVIFYDQAWVEIGTKNSLQEAISEITGIPRQVLGLDTEYKTSVATRMSWASRRNTTRPEDMAYCLMGIFGVNMPLLYGEGENAFTRLQHEIIQVSDDHSIFAWAAEVDTDSARGLIARSPADFVDAAKVIPFNFNTRVSPYSSTNFGLHIQLPLRPLAEEDGIYAAILNCKVIDRDGPVEIFMKCLIGNRFARIRSDEISIGDDNLLKRSKVRGMYVIGNGLSTSNLPQESPKILPFFLEIPQLLQHGLRLLKASAPEKAIPDSPEFWINPASGNQVVEGGQLRHFIFQYKGEEIFTVALYHDPRKVWCDIRTILERQCSYDRKSFHQLPHVEQSAKRLPSGKWVSVTLRKRVFSIPPLLKYNALVLIHENAPHLSALSLQLPSKCQSHCLCSVVFRSDQHLLQLQRSGPQPTQMYGREHRVLSLRPHNDIQTVKLHEKNGAFEFEVKFSYHLQSHSLSVITPGLLCDSKAEFEHHVQAGDSFSTVLDLSWFHPKFDDRSRWKSHKRKLRLKLIPKATLSAIPTWLLDLIPDSSITSSKGVSNLTTDTADESSRKLFGSDNNQRSE